MSAVLDSFANPVKSPLRHQTKTTLPVEQLRMRCVSCHLGELCFPCGVAGSDVRRLDELKFGRRKVKIGQTLYRDGDRFQFFYAVRSGTFRSNLMLSDGREQVNGFYMAGEIMGLDGIAFGLHASSATALEDAEVCAIPYAHLVEIAAGNSSLQQVMSRMMSREILREHSLMMLLGSMNAEERLAAFLLNLSHRLKVRAHAAPRQRADGGGRVGRAKRGGAHLLNIKPALLRHDGQCVEIRCLALIGAHTQCGVALEVFNRLVAFQMGQSDIVNGYVALKIDKRFVTCLA